MGQAALSKADLRAKLKIKALLFNRKLFYLNKKSKEKGDEMLKLYSLQ